MPSNHQGVPWRCSSWLVEVALQGQLPSTCTAKGHACANLVRAMQCMAASRCCRHVTAGAPHSSPSSQSPAGRSLASRATGRALSPGTRHRPCMCYHLSIHVLPTLITIRVDSMHSSYSKRTLCQPVRCVQLTDALPSLAALHELLQASSAKREKGRRERHLPVWQTQVPLPQAP